MPTFPSPQNVEQTTPASQTRTGGISDIEVSTLSANKISNATPTVEDSATNSNKAAHLNSSLSKKFSLLSIHELGHELKEGFASAGDHLKEGFASAGDHLKESFHVWSHPEETRCSTELRRCTEVRKSREIRRSVDKRRSNPDHNSGRNVDATTVTKVSPSGNVSKVVTISMSESETARVERKARTTSEGSMREHMSLQERRNSKLKRNGCYKFTRFTFFVFTFVLCFPFACFCGYAVTRCLDRSVTGVVRFFTRPFRKHDEDDDCYDDEEDGEYGQCEYDEEEGEYGRSQNGDPNLNSQGAAHGSKTGSAHGSRCGNARGGVGSKSFGGHESNRPAAVVASALAET